MPIPAGQKRFMVVKEEIDPTTHANMGLVSFFETDVMDLATGVAFVGAQLFRTGTLIWDWSVMRYIGGYEPAIP